MAIGGAIATGLQVGSQLGQAFSAPGLAKSVSQDELIRARAVREEGEFREKRTKRDFRTLLGKQKTKLAKSGFLLEGSPLLILEQTIRDEEEELKNIRISTARQVGGIEQRARNIRAQGRQALFAGILGATGKAAGGFAKGGAFAGGGGGSQFPTPTQLTRR